MFLVALTVSAIAAWYAVTGLMAIFAAAAVSIAIMGCALEASKLVIASWVYRNWDEAPKKLKYPFVVALIILMTLTSMGIFGYLSKAHIDQGVPTGNIAAQVALIDEKIKTEKETIDEYRRTLAQLDSQVNETIARTANDTTDKGVRRAIAARKSQARERTEIKSAISEAQKKVASYQEQRGPLADTLRKVEAEVGPIKYIAALIYGDQLDQTVLEKAVRIVIIMIVSVFDPLAVLMLIAANWSLMNSRKKKEIHAAGGDDSEESHTAQEMLDIGREILKNQRPLDPEDEKLLFDNLWDLYEESPKEEPKQEHAYLKQPWAWFPSKETNDDSIEYDSVGRRITPDKPHHKK